MAREMKLFRQNSRVSIDSRGQLQPPKEIAGVDGMGFGGERMTPQQIKTALKIHKLAKEKEEDFEKIASNLGLDIDKMALDIVSAPSPTNRRQIVRRVKGEGNESTMGGKRQSFADNGPSFNLNMMTNPRLGSDQLK